MCIRDRPTTIGAFIIPGHRTGYRKGYDCHPREIRLSVRLSENHDWKEVGRFVRYKREEGRIFPIGFWSPEGPPKAKQVKFEILSNHGAPYLEVSEFRLYRAFKPFE